MMPTAEAEAGDQVGGPPGGLREEKGLVRPACKHAGATPLPYHEWQGLLGCGLKEA